jgi:uncharacterized protein YlxW (UPF0749 family)
MYSCKDCKSEDVEVKAWWNPNTSRHVEMIEYEDGYCHGCNATRAIVVEGISSEASLRSTKEPLKGDSTTDLKKEIESLESKLEDLTSVVELIDDKVDELDDYTNKSTDFEDRVLDIFSKALKDTVIRLT